MSKCRIFIVRHAETIGNIEKRLTGRHHYEITEKGKQEIDRLTETLKNIEFNKIYSSTQNRTKKTILPLAMLNQKTIIQNENLCEMNFGIYDGWKWEDVDKVNPEIRRNQAITNMISGIPGQETIDAVANRMYSYISEIARENNGKNILIASHGVAIEAFLRKIENVPFNEQKERFCQHNAEINEIVYEDGKFKILKIAAVEIYLKSEKRLECF